METGISSIAAKIDAVLTKLGAMDSGKAMRRAMMNKKLNSVMADDNGERERERERERKIEFLIGWKKCNV